MWVLPGSVTVQLRPLHLHIRSGPAFKAHWADGSKAQRGLGRDPVLLRRCRGTVSRPSCWLPPELCIWQRFVWQRAGCDGGSAAAVTHTAAERGATCLFAGHPDPPPHPTFPQNPLAELHSEQSCPAMSEFRRSSKACDLGHDDRRRSNYVRSCPLLASCFILCN